MRVGTLVNHKKHFGVGIVTDVKDVNGRTQLQIHWLRSGKTTGWAWRDYKYSLEVICE